MSCLMSAVGDLDRFTSFTSSGRLSQSATSASSIATDTPYDFPTFLGIAQSLNLDFLPISWDTGQANIGQGGTAEISQSSINLEKAFAFKRLTSVDSAVSEAKKTAIFEALVAEISVLSHTSIRGHPNINRLEGICWDVEPESERVWPVLVFENTQHGDLGTFMEHGAGTNLDLRNRLKLCVGVADAVSDLHLNGIIHGDIKPANVLIFENESKQFAARVADFGYSTWLGSANDMVLMPQTPHWTAPEWHHRPITSMSAVRLDIYSFGLLCLWLLFYRGEETTRRGSHEEMESSTMTSNLAHQLVIEMTDVSDEQRSNLHQLFDLSLAIDPTERCSSIGQLVCLLAPDRILDPQHHKTLGSDWPMFPKDFRVTSSIFRLYETHYKVRAHIAACLEEGIFKSSAPSQRAAFELSFCYTLGFGVNKDDAKASALLKQAARSQEELNNEIDRVRRGRSRSSPRGGLYNQSLYQGHTIIRSTKSGRYYLEKGTLDEAASHIRKEITDVESIVGVEHRISRVLKSTLAKVLTLQEKWEEAQELETQVLQWSSKTLGERHPDTLAAGSSLAAIHRKHKKWKEAELLQRQVMIASLSELGLNHGTTLSSMSNLASIFQDQGKWESAERLGKQVLEITKDALGLEHPETINISEILTSYKKEQDNRKREEIRVVQYEQTGTSLILPTISTVSSPAHLQGKQKQTEDYVLRMLEMKEEVLGRDHPLILSMLMTLATMYQDQGRWKEAEEKALEVVGFRKKKHPGHPSTVTAMIRLGSIYLAQGRWKDAEELQLQTIDASSTMEANATERLLVMSHLASNYSRQGRLSEAERLQVDIMEANITQLGREDLITLNSMGSLSLTYMRQGRWKDAEVLALQVANSRQTSLGPDSPATLASLSNLVSVYKGQEQWEEAESLATQVVNKRKKILGDSHPKTLKPMHDLAIIWHARKRHKEALILMSKVVGLSETALGSGHPNTVSRKQTFDEWVSQANQYPSAGDDEGAGMLIYSHGTGSLIREGPTQTTQVTTKSAQYVESPVNYKNYSGIRKPDSRRRQMLNAFERQFASRSASDNIPQGFDRKARKVRDLLIEYGVD